MKTVSHRIILKFPHLLVEQPIVYKLVKEYDLSFNILRASITPDEEGLLVLELSGEEKDYARGIKYLKDLGVIIHSFENKIKWLKDKCIHCGACVVMCPSDALVMDQETKKLNFAEEKCIACLSCIPACPVRAIEEDF